MGKQQMFSSITKGGTTVSRAPWLVEVVEVPFRICVGLVCFFNRESYFGVGLEQMYDSIPLTLGAILVVVAGL